VLQNSKIHRGTKWVNEQQIVRHVGPIILLLFFRFLHVGCKVVPRLWSRIQYCAYRFVLYRIDGLVILFGLQSFVLSAVDGSTDMSGTCCVRYLGNSTQGANGEGKERALSEMLVCVLSISNC
jgi:hypothetical protein